MKIIFSERKTHPTHSENFSDLPLRKIFPQRTIGRTQTSCQTASMTLWCASLLNARDRQMTV